LDDITSLGFRTDLMLLRIQGSSIERREGYRLVRSPHNPAFHWGNFLLLDAPPAPGSVRGWVQTFGSEFPDATHLTLGIDGTAGQVGDAAELSAAGLEVDASTVMIARELRQPAHPNLEAEFRILRDDDWPAALELSMLNNPSDDVDFEPFERDKFVAMRSLQERGFGGWFGAFIDGRMVAGLGLFSDGNGIARYQAVDTHPKFRRRGLAGSLVHFAGARALAEGRAHTLVIVADPEYVALRLYRSLGFDGTEAQVQLARP
jgi:GNAT superfamily N-acetyltransferase